jgi:hypothetical protein
MMRTLEPCVLFGLRFNTFNLCLEDKEYGSSLRDTAVPRTLFWLVASASMSYLMGSTVQQTGRLGSKRKDSVSRRKRRLSLGVPCRMIISYGHFDVRGPSISGVLGSQGGFCDCQILYNVTESSRLKTRLLAQLGEVLRIPPDTLNPLRHADDSLALPVTPKSCTGEVNRC